MTLSWPAVGSLPRDLSADTSCDSWNALLRMDLLHLLRRGSLQRHEETMKPTLAIIVALLLAYPVAAQEPVISSSEIEKALQQPKTRSLGRGIGVKAKVDLYVPFEFNSARLVPAAEDQLTQLSKALTGASLSSYRFEIAGHTDASGAADYNRTLSEQRAEAVMQFLVDRGISRNRLTAVGYGEDKLLREDQPTHAANRRVEVRNLGVASQ